MLAYFYHTYTDTDENNIVSGDAFNIWMSNIENTIYDMIDKVNNKLESKWLIAIMVWSYEVWDMIQDYDIYDYISWYINKDYINNSKSVWYGRVLIKED